MVRVVLQIRDKGLDMLNFSIGVRGTVIRQNIEVSFGACWLGWCPESRCNRGDLAAQTVQLAQRRAGSKFSKTEVGEPPFTGLCLRMAKGHWLVPAYEDSRKFSVSRLSYQGFPGAKDGRELTNLMLQIFHLRRCSATSDHGDGIRTLAKQGPREHYLGYPGLPCILFSRLVSTAGRVHRRPHCAQDRCNGSYCLHPRSPLSRIEREGAAQEDQVNHRPKGKVAEHDGRKINKFPESDHFGIVAC